MKVVQEADKLQLIAEEDFVFAHAEKIQSQLLEGLQNYSGNSVTLDLTQIGAIDSLGIKLVIGLLKSCQKKQQVFQVEVASQAVARVFKLCKLTDLLNVREVLPNG